MKRDRRQQLVELRRLEQRLRWRRRRLLGHRAERDGPEHGNHDQSREPSWPAPPPRRFSARGADLFRSSPSSPFRCANAVTESPQAEAALLALTEGYRYSTAG